jgi:hypothetical protein
VQAFTAPVPIATEEFFKPFDLQDQRGRALHGTAEETGQSRSSLAASANAKFEKATNLPYGLPKEEKENAEKVQSIRNDHSLTAVRVRRATGTPVIGN